MRIAEFLFMEQDPVREAFRQYDAEVDEEGNEPYDFGSDTGTAILMETLMLDMIEGVGDRMTIPAILRMVVGKAFRVGCGYGRAVIPPEERD